MRIRIQNTAPREGYPEENDWPGEIPKNLNNSAKSYPKSKIYLPIFQWPNKVRIMKRIGVENLVGLSLYRK